MILIHNEKSLHLIYMTLFTYCKTEYYFCAHNLSVAIHQKKIPLMC